MILYATATFFSTLFGRITNLYTIVPLYVFYWILTTASFVFMLFYKSNPESIYKILILAVLLGTVESLNTQLPRSKLVLVKYFRYIIYMQLFKLYMPLYSRRMLYTVRLHSSKDWDYSLAFLLHNIFALILKFTLFSHFVAYQLYLAQLDL
jgi:hypothetical protein